MRATHSAAEARTGVDGGARSYSPRSMNTMATPPHCSTKGRARSPRVKAPIGVPGLDPHRGSIRQLTRGWWSGLSASLLARRARRVTQAKTPTRKAYQPGVPPGRGEREHEASRCPPAVATPRPDQPRQPRHDEAARRAPRPATTAPRTRAKPGPRREVEREPARPRAHPADRSLTRARRGEGRSASAISAAPVPRTPRSAATRPGAGPGCSATGRRGVERRPSPRSPAPRDGRR